MRFYAWFLYGCAIIACLCLPSISFATNIHDVVSFNPVPGDLSITFLKNIFGVVDGVLAGTGSQILGAMFGVFNAAVIAVGGIILGYMLLVSTLNMSNDGKFIGQKWSSLWIPLRSTFGVGLLLPQASGYCIIQIFLMFVVVQGVGAADSMWNKALGYLNRGGVIMQKQMKLSDSSGAGDGKIMNAAMGMLAGQVCMQALQINYADLRRKEWQAGGECTTAKADDSPNYWYEFCNNEVPKFMETVQILSEENLQSTAGDTISMAMPFFGEESPDNTNIYIKLNGICGLITWKVYQAQNIDESLTTSEQELTTNSRTIAVGQMYEALVQVSNAMINNAPIYNSSIECNDADLNKLCRDDEFAQYSFGYPYAQNFDSACEGGRTVPYSNPMACKNWGVWEQTAMLFSGRELIDAVAVYNGVILPTINLDTLNTASTKSDYEQRRSFIRKAQSQGWIMAGSYFFRLAMLNNYVLDTTSSAATTDENSELYVFGEQVTAAGVSRSNWIFKPIKEALQPDNAATPQCLNGQNYDTQPFCHIGATELNQLGKFIAGEGNESQYIPTYRDTINNQPPTRPFNSRNTNIYTFLINGNSIVLPDQKTVLDAGLNSDSITSFNPDQSVQKLSRMSFSGGRWGIAGAVAGFMWNDFMRPVWNMILDLIIPPIMELFSMMLTPIIGMSAVIFNNALDIMRVEGVNPIMAIAEMGVRFIDGIGDSWIQMLLYTVPAAVFPPAFGLIMMLSPIVTSWMGIMLTVGFTSAFYVPFVPMLVFTFAAIAWLIAVMEGMVAAPIVALGVMHPEGDSDPFGKADPAIMLILNMFLRPSLMIIGYILGIGMSYVGVWIMNAGFNLTLRDMTNLSPISENNITPQIVTRKSDAMYGFWTNIMLFYFSILTYTTLYLSIAQQSFEMIHMLPDKILRWISGGVQEQLGDGIVKPMIQQVKTASDDAASQSSQAIGKAQSGMNKTMSGGLMDPDDDGGDGGGGGSSGAQGGGDKGGGDKGGGDKGGGKPPAPTGG